MKESQKGALVVAVVMAMVVLLRQPLEVRLLLRGKKISC